MRLTQHTDYGLRILLYLGLKGKQATAAELAKNFRMSHHHVAKIVHHLGQLGWLETVKGKGGGVSLAPVAIDLTVAEVAEKLEPDFHLVECFNAKENHCPIAGVCHLEHLLHEARRAFFAKLGATKIKDLIVKRERDPRLKKLNLT